MYVIGCCSAMRLADIPDRFAFKQGVSVSASGWVNPGDSVIIDPDGKLIAGPLKEEQSILFGEVDPQRITGPRWQLDVAGHYSRPDVLELVVHAGRGRRGAGLAVKEP
jgi:nitrilase